MVWEGVLETMKEQSHSRITKPSLDLLDSLVELDFRICGAEIPNTFGVDKDHVLLTAHKKPQDEGV
jgi:hypothetical protein